MGGTRINCLCGEVWDGIILVITLAITPWPGPTLEGVATEGDGVHHPLSRPRVIRIIPNYSRPMITPRPRHTEFFCPIFLVLFCKLKHKTGIFRVRNNSVSQRCGVAEDWRVFRCISRLLLPPAARISPASQSEAAWPEVRPMAGPQAAPSSAQPITDRPRLRPVEAQKPNHPHLLFSPKLSSLLCARPLAAVQSPRRRLQQGSKASWTAATVQRNLNWIIISI